MSDDLAKALQLTTVVDFKIEVRDDRLLLVRDLEGEGFELHESKEIEEEVVRALVKLAYSRLADSGTKFPLEYTWLVKGFQPVQHIAARLVVHSGTPGKAV